MFFRQKRIGRNKKLFTILKFRTMRTDAPKDTPTHLLADPGLYITRIGRVLRKTSLDELPQIFNIFAGRMSVIGPRPALYNQDDLVALRDQYNANGIRPGLTGLAQIKGRDELELDAKARLDGEYAARMSLWRDIKIFFGTLFSVFRSKGVREGKAGTAENRILYLTQKLYKLEYGNGIYSDLCMRFKETGQKVTVIATSHLPNSLHVENGITVINVFIGQQFGVNYIKKGLSFLKMPARVKKAVKKYLRNEKFDLILLEAPPVMFGNCLPFLKRIFNCKVYLMQKDIFPQNALDLGILKKHGIKGFIYRYFKKKEKNLYKQSGRIGCMSQKNIDYLAANNPEIKPKLELFCNSILPREKALSEEIKTELRKKYNIDKEKINFIYGGNLGKPQGLPILLEGIRLLSDFKEAHFYIIGRGTEKKYVEETAKIFSNLTFFEFMPHDDFNNLVACCDVGIVALDYRFTIPNYPSRVLNYMDNGLAVIALTDNITDFRDLILTEAYCGLWSDSKDIAAFVDNVKKMCDNKDELKIMGSRGREYLLRKFHVNICAEQIIDFIKNSRSLNGV